ncbi:MAG: radical SAM protein, partial [Bdellovibrionales bacterium]
FVFFYIVDKSMGSPVAESIQTIFPENKIRFVENEPWAESRRSILSAEDFSRSKRNIFVTPFKGQFFKRCPGSSQAKVLNCCNYHVLNLGSQCNMNCSYCYLQSYLNSPIMKIYSNIHSALSELSEMAQVSGNLPFRVGTGEIIDSLSIDEITLYSRLLIEHFKKFPHWTLEFKTKSNKVDQFLDLAPAKNVVVSWSLNCEEMITHEEHGTANLNERLEAAEKCLQSGFQVAFHIDPMIWHPEWKENYGRLAEQIQKRFKPEEVNVISLGTLRYQPEQRQMMKQRFGMSSWVTRAEMFPSEGDKLRYDSGLRNEMFKFMYQNFKSHCEKWRLFLCMETPETWVTAFESQPMQKPELRELFRPLPKV